MIRGFRLAVRTGPDAGKRRKRGLSRAQVAGQQLHSSGHCDQPEGQKDSDGDGEDSGDDAVEVLAARFHNRQPASKQIPMCRERTPGSDTEPIIIHSSPVPVQQPGGGASPPGMQQRDTRQHHKSASESKGEKRNDTLSRRRESAKRSPPSGPRFKAPLALTKAVPSEAEFNPAPLFGTISLPLPPYYSPSTSLSSASGSALVPSSQRAPSCLHGLPCVRQYSKTKARHFWGCSHPLPHLRCGVHYWVEVRALLPGLYLRNLASSRTGTGYGRRSKIRMKQS